MNIEPANMLQLEGYYVDHVHCSARRADDGLPGVALTPGLHVQTKKPMGIRPYNLIFSIEAGQHEKDPTRFMVVLRIESDEESSLSPYLFDVTLVGYFRSERKPSVALRPHLVSNAAMILYSSARELLASITGRGPYPAIVLPTMYFDPEKQLQEQAIARKRSKGIVSRTARKASKKR
jgi:preprotein translocase subunit SecB